MYKSLLRYVKTNPWDVLIALLVLLEVAFMLYFHKGMLPNIVNEIGFTLTSILIGIALLLKYYGKEVHYLPTAPANRQGSLKWIVYSALTCGMLVFAMYLTGLFNGMAVNAGSDIIPLIQIGVQRFLNGETVYAIIDESVYRGPLTYLPMQWLPYTMTELLHWDYRWMAVLIFYLACYLVAIRSTKVSPLRGLAITGLLIYFGIMLLVLDTGILTMTVELMVAGYYMLLIAGIGGRNPWLRGAGIALCLLSRYSLILWLPLWACVEFVAGGRKDFFRSCGIIVLLVLGLYIIPFLSHDWSTFGQSYHYYSRAAMGEWNNIDGRGVPYQLDHGLGFARLFYEKLWHYSVPDRLKSLQKVHFVLCVGSTIVMGIWYLAVRRRIHPRIFLMASFKIYLSIFLAFIQVPYPYLMITAAVVSIAIFAELPRYKRLPLQV